MLLKLEVVSVLISVTFVKFVLHNRDVCSVSDHNTTASVHDSKNYLYSLMVLDD